jgi:hypothetical protein
MHLGALIKINVIPFKPKQFAQPHSRSRGHKKKGIIFCKMCFTSTKEQGKLMFCETFCFFYGFPFDAVLGKRRFTIPFVRFVPINASSDAKLNTPDRTSLISMVRLREGPGTPFSAVRAYPARGVKILSTFADI